jgi:3-methyladenine DNA glycosylase AlkC
MTAGDGYGKLYKGVKSQVDKWSDDELEAVRRLAEADTQPTPRSLEIIEAITSEMEQRGKGAIDQGMKKA